MERYIVDGQPYDVAPNRLDEFLKKFPNASKTQDVKKTIDVAEKDAPVTSQKQNMASNLGVYSLGSLSTKLAAAKLIGKTPQDNSPMKFKDTNMNGIPDEEEGVTQRKDYAEPLPENEIPVVKPKVKPAEVDKDAEKQEAVSYTHLTLPTKRIV